MNAWVKTLQDMFRMVAVRMGREFREAHPDED